MTLADVLHGAAQRLAAAAIEDPRLEAEVLLMHALRIDRERLYVRLQEALPSKTREGFEALLTRRLAHEPSAYITGHKEFYGLDFACTPDAIVPRPESELLVELALDWVAGRGSRVAEPLVVDVGTGNGAIAVAIAANAAQARVLAIDPSRPALRLARANAVRHGVSERIDFLQGSLLGPLRRGLDVVVANLPYISTSEYQALPHEIHDYEPEDALHAGLAGTELIEELLQGAPALLNQGGLLVAEHAWDQGERLRDAARAAFPQARVETKRDLAGLERALVVETR